MGSTNFREADYADLVDRAGAPVSHIGGFQRHVDVWTRGAGDVSSRVPFARGVLDAIKRYRMMFAVPVIAARPRVEEFERAEDLSAVGAPADRW